MYDPINPPALDLTDLNWALWMARTASGDVSSSPIWTDGQWTATLQISSTSRVISTVDTIYYRPYEAAARFLLSPENIIKRDTGSISETYISPLDVATELRNLQDDLDSLIPTGDDDSGNASFRCFVGGWE